MNEAFMHPDGATQKLIEENRDYLLSLRSEDEQLRFVENLEREIQSFPKETVNVPQKH